MLKRKNYYLASMQQKDQSANIPSYHHFFYKFNLFRHYLANNSKMLSENCPEILNKLYIINAPFGSQISNFFCFDDFGLENSEKHFGAWPSDLAVKGQITT
jgi:hypothetical protein